LAQLCLAWVVKNPDVSTCIVGASKAEQLVENLGCLKLIEKLTCEVELQIEEILGNAPLGEMNWIKFERLPPRRHILLKQEKNK